MGWNMSTFLYGFIIFLYFGVALMFIWFFSSQKNVDRVKNRWSQRRQKRKEYYEQERRRERERKIREQEAIFFAEKQKILGTTTNNDITENAANEVSCEIKQTEFEQPTVEEIKQLEEKPKPLIEKKME